MVEERRLQAQRLAVSALKVQGAQRAQTGPGQRTEPDLISQWNYDRKFDNTACGKGIGKLCEAKANNGYLRTHTYDSLGRPASTTTLLDKASTVSTSYDVNTGRVATKTWPTGYQANYQYTADGYLKLVVGSATNTPPAVFEVLAMDARGNITSYRQGNQITVVRGFGATSGRLKSQQATRYGSVAGNVLDQTYAFDSLGNLKTRADNTPGIGTREGFSYGLLNNGSNPTQAVADRTLAFVYGPEHQRVKQQITLSVNAPSTYSAGATWYLNGEDSLGLSFEREVKTSGLVEERHYLNAGGISFALYVKRTGNRGTLPPGATRYFQHDNLGSIAVVTDHVGQVVERLAYDPWGKRRNVNGTPDVLDNLVGVNTDRGYTMHEHLDEVGVIHMNGRIYDPLIGRFMSADPFIQSPGNLQSHNRYAYVLNNPLSHTDPSGYFSLKKFVRTIVSVVVAYYTGNWVGAATGSTVAGGAAGGFAAGAVSTGTLNGAMQGAFGGALFGAAGLAGGPGEFGANSMARYAAHAGAGCVSSAAFGGSCGSGATSALFGKFASNKIEGIGGDGVEGDIARGVAASVAGGVGSVIGGGKFENGAVTAAFGYLFNQVLSNLARQEALQRGTCSTPSVACSQRNTEYRSAYEAAVQGQAIQPIIVEDGLLAVGGGLRLVGESTITLYRSVSAAELGSLGRSGFSVGGGAEGKYFAESLKDAEAWGAKLGNPHVLQVNVPTSVANQMYRWERLDGIGPARFGTMDQLRDVTIKRMR